MRFGRGACAIVGVGNVVRGRLVALARRRAARRHVPGVGRRSSHSYSTAPLNNVVEHLNRQLQDGSVGLTFEGRSGYLRSAIDALKLPIDSQLLVFSKASLQGRLISPLNPRALFFNDRVVLAWVRDGELLEAAAHDEQAGVAFYTLEQRPAQRPMFKREFRCLGCHMTGDTLGVPGLLMFSTRPTPAIDP